jgi:hypothetical protein
MPPDPNIIVHEVFSWVVPGLITIILGFPIVRLITRWLEPRSVPPRELSSINGRLEHIEAAGMREMKEGASFDAPSFASAAQAD